LEILDEEVFSKFGMEKRLIMIVLNLISELKESKCKFVLF
jgi:hypothetical protein